MLLPFALLAAPALAQDAPPPPPPPAAAVPAPVDLGELEAAAAYKVGLELMALGQWAGAHAVLQDVAAGGSSYADEAQEQLALLDQVRAGQARAGRDPYQSGRVELALEQAVAMPVFLGVLVPGATFQPSEPLAFVLMGVGGLGAGIAGSLALTHFHPVTQGQALAVFQGEWLGAMNGLAMSALAVPRDYRGVWRYTAGGMALGLVGGGAVALWREPSAGDASLVNWGAALGTGLGAMTFLLWQPDTSRGVTLFLVGLADAGAAVGAGLAVPLDPSRLAVNVAGLSAAAGFGVGLSAAFLQDFYGSEGSTEGSVYAWMTGGTLVGLTGGVFAARALDRRAADGAMAWDFVPVPLVVDGSPGLALAARF